MENFFLELMKIWAPVSGCNQESYNNVFKQRNIAYELK